MGIDEDDTDEEQYPQENADYRYDSWVEDSMIALDEDIRELVKRHFKGKGYYSQREADKFAQAVISEVLSHTDTKLQIDEDGEIKVVIDRDKLFDKL